MRSALYLTLSLGAGLWAGLVGCVPPEQAVADRVGEVAVVTAVDDAGLVATLWRARAADDGRQLTQIGAARWDDERAELQAVGLTRAPTSTAAPAYRGRMSRSLLVTILAVAAEAAPARCRDGSCFDRRGLEPEQRFGARAARAILDLDEAPLDDGALDEEAGSGAVFNVGQPAREQAITSCAAFPGYRGDGRCTGWTSRLLSLGGSRDVGRCCVEHDGCFFGCPLSPDGACRGTSCIETCNARLAGCCLESGGAPLECGTYEVGTDLVGGGGRNGCGKDKARSFCERQDFEHGCEGARCLCEECAALFPGEVSCGGCSCVDECSPDEPPRCQADGRGQGVLSCKQVAYDEDNACFKWTEQRCGPAEVCVLRPGEATPACELRGCALEPPCREVGEREPTCRVDATGPYFRVCALDADGCLTWRRQYCDFAGVSACVVFDDVPVCR